MRFLRVGCAAAVLLGLAACVSSGDESADFDASHLLPLIEPITKIPQAAPAKELGALPEMAEFDPGLVMMSRIDRPRAEVRLGPGPDYPLSDAVLTQDLQVITWQKVGVWQKIVTLNGEIQGWVHSAALGKMSVNQQRLKLKVATFPIVSLVRDVTAVFDYASAEEVQVVWPRGTMYVMLMENSRRKLLWVKNTNSVAWINREDAQ